MATRSSSEEEEEVTGMEMGDIERWSFEEVASRLPKKKGWMGEAVYQYQGFWHPEFALTGVLLAQQHFSTASPSNLLLASYPKSGTTWLKALTFAITNRALYSSDDHHHPLLSANPHDLIDNLELYLQRNSKDVNEPLTSSSHRPVWSTHIAFSSLPASVSSSSSACKIVYIYRDPKDVFVSVWYFVCKLWGRDQPPISLEEAFRLFSSGVSPAGPVWDHVLGYWKASLEWPDRVLFLKYEEMKRDAAVHVKRLAEFVGQPFSPEEESGGEVESIISLCGFEKMKNLEVNKSGKRIIPSEPLVLPHAAFFRKGEVGDWENLLTAEMAECLNRITEMKFKGTPLFSVLS